jgi:hypothetical protein
VLAGIVLIVAGITAVLFQPRPRTAPRSRPRP